VDGCWKREERGERRNGGNEGNEGTGEPFFLFRRKERSKEKPLWEGFRAAPSLRAPVVRKGGMRQREAIQPAVPPAVSKRANPQLRIRFRGATRRMCDTADEISDWIVA